MKSLSTERLEPTSRAAEVQGQQPRRDAPPKSRRRPAPPPRSHSEEGSDDSENTPHQVDRLA